MNPESCINKYAVSIGGTYEFALAGTWAPDKNHTSLASFPSLHSTKHDQKSKSWLPFSPM